MAAKDRIRRLEARMGLDAERPCEACGNKPWGVRSIGVIEVMVPGANYVL